MPEGAALASAGHTRTIYAIPGEDELEEEFQGRSA